MLHPLVSRLPAPLASMASRGYLAVQTFFVLSGFVLARTYARTQWNRTAVIRYVSARLARIYPAYIVSLAVSSYFIVRYLSKIGAASGEKAWNIASYILLLQGWRRGAGPGWNTPAWSLSCELFFYLVLPAILPAIWRARSQALAVIIAVSFAAPVLMAHMGLPFYLKPIYHFADFTMGIAAARVFGWLEMRRLPPSGSRFYVPAIAVGALLIAFPRVLEGTWLDMNSALRPINALGLIGLALGGGAVARLLSTRPVEYLGQASYSLYILHVPLLWWYGNHGLPGMHLPWAAAAALYIAIAIPAAIACYEFIEKPANQSIRKWTESRLRTKRELRAAA